MTPRENMLNIMSCKNPEWIPLIFYADPYNHPDPKSFPEPLASLVEEKATNWGTMCETFIPVSKFLGIDEYVFQAPPPFMKYLSGDVKEQHYTEGDINVGKITTHSGEIEERRKNGFLLKPYIETAEDVTVFREYTESWRYKIMPDYVDTIKKMKEMVGENGIIRYYDNGTPLGMMYRVYSNIENIVYLAHDIPDQVNELFGVMENKYLQEMTFVLENAPEIDVLVGMDDTSSTLVSPSMFEYFNAELTDKRVEKTEKYGKFYMHHSCGLLRHLLPVYKKTHMHGVDAFCRPPIGDITWDEGRNILGNKICICSGILGGLYFPDKETIIRSTREACEDAKAAGFIMLRLASPDPQHSIELIQIALDEARKTLKK
jgi:hypothetical protein